MVWTARSTAPSTVQTNAARTTRDPFAMVWLLTVSTLGT